MHFKSQVFLGGITQLSISDCTTLSLDASVVICRSCMSDVIVAVHHTFKDLKKKGLNQSQLYSHAPA